MNEGRPGFPVQGNPTVAPVIRPGVGHGGAAPSGASTGGMSSRPTIAVAAPPPTRPLMDEPLELVEEKPVVGTTEAPKSKIHGITAAVGIAQHTYKRPTNLNKCGAVRMRTFHSRLSEQGVEYLDQAINDWLEAHPDIEVKFTTSTVGMWDGKLKEPTLILNVWY
jgi:hypothetical protein